MNENEIPKESPEYNLGKIDVGPSMDQALEDHFKNCETKSRPGYPAAIKTVTLSVLVQEDKEMECMSLISQIMTKYGLPKENRIPIARWFSEKYI